MEFVEYMPGALAAGWMAFKIVVLLRHGPQEHTEEPTAFE